MHQWVVTGGNKRSRWAVAAVDNSDPRDPTARCERCGKPGTIARATRYSDPPVVLRYCGDCWPSAQREIEILQREEMDQWNESLLTSSNWDELTPPTPWGTASRSWHDVLRFLELIRQPTKGGPAPTSEILAAFASEIRAVAGEMSGDMPPEVEDFISRHE